MSNLFIFGVGCNFFSFGFIVKILLSCLRNARRRFSLTTLLSGWHYARLDNNENIFRNNKVSFTVYTLQDDGGNHESSEHTNESWIREMFVSFLFLSSSRLCLISLPPYLKSSPNNTSRCVVSVTSIARIELFSSFIICFSNLLINTMSCVHFIGDHIINKTQSKHKDRNFSFQDASLIAIEDFRSQ